MSSGSTSRAGVPYPLSSDSAVVAADIQAVAQFIDSNIPLFVKSATQPASPIEDMIWWCTDNTSASFGFNWYVNGAFYNVTNEVFTVASSAPSPKFSGMLWYDTTSVNGELKYWNGSAWVDIIPVPGANGQVLTSSSTGLKWVTPASISSVPSTSGVPNGYTLANVSGSPTWAATTLPANGVITAPVEQMTITATASTGTVAVPVGTSAGVYATSNATGNFTLNVTGVGTALAVGQSITVVYMNTNGSTAYYANAFSIDGTSVTPKWQGGSGAPSAGNANSVDAYSLTIIKTASTPTYTVLASLTTFA